MKNPVLLAILLALLVAATVAVMLKWPELYTCDQSKPAGPAIGHVLRIMGCQGAR
jgi:hypothetical protein